MDKLISATELHKIGDSLSYFDQIKATICPVKHVGYRLFVFLHGDKYAVFKDSPEQVYFSTMEEVLDAIGDVKSLAQQVTLDVNNWPSKAVGKRYEFSPQPRWIDQQQPCVLKQEEDAVF